MDNFTKNENLVPRPVFEYEGKEVLPLTEEEDNELLRELVKHSPAIKKLVYLSNTVQEEIAEMNSISEENERNNKLEVILGLYSDFDKTLKEILPDAPSIYPSQLHGLTDLIVGTEGFLTNDDKILKEKVSKILSANKDLIRENGITSILPVVSTEFEKFEKLDTENDKQRSNIGESVKRVGRKIFNIASIMTILSAQGGNVMVEKDASQSESKIRYAKFENEEAKSVYGEIMSEIYHEKTLNKIVDSILSIGGDIEMKVRQDMHNELPDIKNIRIEQDTILRELEKIKAEKPKPPAKSLEEIKKENNDPKRDEITHSKNIVLSKNEKLPKSRAEMSGVPDREAFKNIEAKISPSAQYVLIESRDYNISNDWESFNFESKDIAYLIGHTIADGSLIYSVHGYAPVSSTFKTIDGKMVDVNIERDKNTGNFKVRTSYSGEVLYNLALYDENLPDYAISENKKYKWSKETEDVLNKAKNLVSQERYEDAVTFVSEFLRTHGKYSTSPELFNKVKDITDRDRLKIGDCDVMNELLYEYLNEIGFKVMDQSCYQDSDGMLVTAEHHGIIKVVFPNGRTILADGTPINFLDKDEYLEWQKNSRDIDFSKEKKLPVPERSDEIISSKEGGSSAESIYSNYTNIEELEEKGFAQTLEFFNVISKMDNDEQRMEVAVKILKMLEAKREKMTYSDAILYSFIERDVSNSAYLYNADLSNVRNEILDATIDLKHFYEYLKGRNEEIKFYTSDGFPVVGDFKHILPRGGLIYEFNNKDEPDKNWIENIKIIDNLGNYYFVKEFLENTQEFSSILMKAEIYFANLISIYSNNNNKITYPSVSIKLGIDENGYNIIDDFVFITNNLKHEWVKLSDFRDQHKNFRIAFHGSISMIDVASENRYNLRNLVDYNNNGGLYVTTHNILKPIISESLVYKDDMISEFISDKDYVMKRYLDYGYRHIYNSFCYNIGFNLTKFLFKYGDIEKSDRSIQEIVCEKIGINMEKLKSDDEDEEERFFNYIDECMMRWYNNDTQSKPNW